MRTHLWVRIVRWVSNAQAAGGPFCQLLAALDVCSRVGASRCCCKYVRGLLMAGHAQTNCFLLFTHNQSLPAFAAPGRVEQEDGWAETGLGGSILQVQVCPVLPKQNPSVPPPRAPLAHRPLPLLLPSWLAPSRLLSAHLPPSRPPLQPRCHQPQTDTHGAAPAATNQPHLLPAGGAC